MAQTVLITLTTAGPATGPFDLYCVNGSTVTGPFETGISRAALLAGYVSVLVPNNCGTIRVKSDNDDCLNYIDLVLPTTTTTTTQTPTTTTTVAPGTTTTTTILITTSTTAVPTTTTTTSSETTTTSTTTSTTTTTTISETTTTTTEALLSNEWVIMNDSGVTSGSAICFLGIGGPTVYSDIPTFTGSMTFYTDIALTIPYDGQNWYHKIFHPITGISYYGKIENAGTIAGLPDTSGSC